MLLPTDLQVSCGARLKWKMRERWMRGERAGLMLKALDGQAARCSGLLLSHSPGFRLWDSVYSGQVVRTSWFFSEKSGESHSPPVVGVWAIAILAPWVWDHDSGCWGKRDHSLKEHFTQKITKWEKVLYESCLIYTSRLVYPLCRNRNVKSRDYGFREHLALEL